MATVRLWETHGDLAVWLRAGCSLAALGVVLAAHRQSLVRRAMFAFALEATAGAFTFAYVDVPFVHGHQAQIGALAVAMYDRFEGDSPVPH